MKTYRTSQIAKMIGVHPNTIRFYEEMKLLPTIPRTASGYRTFNDKHIWQLRLLRAAFRSEIVSSRLRQEAFDIVKLAAEEEYEEVYRRTEEYLQHLQEEKAGAEDAIHITLDIIKNSQSKGDDILYYGRRKTAEYLNITVDVLRDWERNGLIDVPQTKNGYKYYRQSEINRLKIIRTLRNAHYSMMSILRMLTRLDQGEMNIRKVIDTPDEEEDIICAADRYITALELAMQDAQDMLEIIKILQKLTL
jgi:DNA-binding transcriptional MerR regulator